MCRETRGDRAEMRPTSDDVRLCHAPADGRDAETVALARFGKYEVRLVEFVPANPVGATPMWLELYSHETRSPIDSYRCYDLEAAVRATEDLISSARKLDEESREMRFEEEF